MLEHEAKNNKPIKKLKIFLNKYISSPNKLS
jgi:hypothetical protein